MFFLLLFGKEFPFLKKFFLAKEIILFQIQRKKNLAQMFLAIENKVFKMEYKQTAME